MQGITMLITKHNHLVQDIPTTSLHESLKKRISLLVQVVPGPVLIDIPKDIQTEKNIHDRIQ